MLPIARQADRIVPIADLNDLPLDNIAKRIAEAKLSTHGSYAFTIDGVRVLFVYSTDALLRTIEALQFIQKRTGPTHEAWRDASIKLEPLFEEMARRQAAGDPLAN